MVLSEVSISVGLASTVTELSTISVSIVFSWLVGVTASALGGVMLKKLLSIPTAGGRPRGRRRLKEALARFCIRQSDHEYRYLIFNDAKRML